MLFLSAVFHGNPNSDEYFTCLALVLGFFSTSNNTLAPCVRYQLALELCNQAKNIGKTRKKTKHAGVYIYLLKFYLQSI